MLRIFMVTVILALIYILPPCPMGAMQDQQRLDFLKPSLEDIKNVDPTTTPWGVDLNLVEKRGAEARKKSLDKIDFSSRITLYQKHKSKAIRLSEEVKKLSERLKNANELLGSHGKETLLNRKKIFPIKAEIESLQAQINTTKENLKTNAIHLKTFRESIKEKVGLTDTQVDSLPDLDSWKKMRDQNVPRQKENKKPILLGHQRLKISSETPKGRERSGGGAPPPLRSQKTLAD